MRSDDEQVNEIERWKEEWRVTEEARASFEAAHNKAQATLSAVRRDIQAVAITNPKLAALLLATLDGVPEVSDFGDEPDCPFHSVRGNQGRPSNCTCEVDE